MSSGRTCRSPWQLAIPLLLVLSVPASASDCVPADISLLTQQSVNNFQQDHGSCDVVTGNLSIVGNDISNLDSLSLLTAVDGNLFISDSPQLASVAGLKTLSKVGKDLTLQANNSLDNFDGLNSLQSVNGNFFIFRNEILTSLSGLESLSSVGGGFYISGNPLLPIVYGLEALGNVDGILRIWDNRSLSNLDGLAGLASVGRLELVGNPSLVNLDGLSNLLTLEGDLLIQANGSLLSIRGLSSLDSDIGILAVLGNPLVTSLDGLDALTRVGQLIITNNNSLSNCQGVLKLVDPIDHAEQGHEYALPNAPDVGSHLVLSGNQPGCNAVAEILAEAPLSNINVGMNDAWYWPENNGQGFFLYVFPDIEQMFLGWFTYDTDEPVDATAATLGDPGHRWLTAQGPFTENLAALDVWNTTGGEFNSGNPAVDRHADGHIQLEFTNCNSGTLSYDIPSISRQGVIPIERTALDNVARCYMLAAGERFVPELGDPAIEQTAYIKAPTIQEGDLFGTEVAVSGSIMVVGAPGEDSAADGVDGDQADDSAEDAGAAFVFEHDGTAWVEQAYLKASNSEGTRGTGSPHDEFGAAVAISGDTIVVGARAEASNSIGVNGDQEDNSTPNAGAVYVFKRENGQWFQQAYLKASNTGSGDRFGHSVDVSGDTIVVGALCESSNATGINGDQQDNSADCSGAAYVFTREQGIWRQQAYLKASNAETEDYFGGAVAISGETIIVGADREDSIATGVNGDQGNSTVGPREGAWADSGAAYIFVRENSIWSQQAYLKASNTEESIYHLSDRFGSAVDVSDDTAVVGAPGEDSWSTGINGNQDNSDEIYDSNVGASYVFVRDENGWSQQAYIKPSINLRVEWFGDAVALSGDKLLVGTHMEANPGTGIDPGTEGGIQSHSGAAFLFARHGDEWSQRAYVKPHNTWSNQGFGRSVATTGDLHVVGGPGDSSGVVDDPLDRSVLASGAVFGFHTALRINAGLNDAWFNPQADGQGFFVNVFHEIEQIFVGWFTFDTERPPGTVQARLGDPGHRWLTAQGAFGHKDALLNLNLTSGGLFVADEPTPGTEPYGELLLEFNDCNAITASYDIPSLGKAGVIPLQRVVGDNAALCEALSAGD